MHMILERFLYHRYNPSAFPIGMLVTTDGRAYDLAMNYVPPIFLKDDLIQPHRKIVHQNDEIFMRNLLKFSPPAS